MPTTEDHAKALLSEPVSELAKGAVCLDCRWKGTVGALIAIDTLRCPQCNSANWHPAEREAIVVPVYHGEIGTKN